MIDTLTLRQAPSASVGASVGAAIGRSSTKPKHSQPTAGSSHAEQAGRNAKSSKNQRANSNGATSEPDRLGETMQSFETILNSLAKPSSAASGRLEVSYPAADLLSSMIEQMGGSSRSVVKGLFVDLVI